MLLGSVSGSVSFLQFIESVSEEAYDQKYIWNFESVRMEMHDEIDHDTRHDQGGEPYKCPGEVK